MSGWIKLHRGIQHHWIFNFDEPDKGMAWIDMLMIANIEPKKFMIKGQVIFCDRGQLAVSQETLQMRWKWSRNKVRSFLELLKKDGMIEINSNHLTSIITICNYNDFQDVDTSEGTAKGTSEGKPEGTSEGTSEGKQLKNIRIKEVKNIRKDISAKNDGFDKFWDVYGKKVDRSKAEKSWSKIAWHDGLLDQIIQAATSYSASIKDRQFQKNPATWLNGECWNDEIVKSKPQSNILWTNIADQDWTKGVNEDGSF